MTILVGVSAYGSHGQRASDYATPVSPSPTPTPKIDYPPTDLRSGFIEADSLRASSGSGDGDDVKVDKFALLPPGTVLDRSYQQNSINAVSGRDAETPLTAGSIPPGFHIECTGDADNGKRWAVRPPYSGPILSEQPIPNQPSLTQYKFTLGIYADTGHHDPLKGSTGGCNVIVRVFYKPLKKLGASEQNSQPVVLSPYITPSLPNKNLKDLRSIADTAAKALNEPHFTSKTDREAFSNGWAIATLYYKQRIEGDPLLTKQSLRDMAFIQEKANESLTILQKYRSELPDFQKCIASLTGLEDALADLHASAAYPKALEFRHKKCLEDVIDLRKHYEVLYQILLDPAPIDWQKRLAVLEEMKPPYFFGVVTELTDYLQADNFSSHE